MQYFDNHLNFYVLLVAAIYSMGSMHPRIHLYWIVISNNTTVIKHQANHYNKVQMISVSVKLLVPLCQNFLKFYTNIAWA